MRYFLYIALVLVRKNISIYSFCEALQIVAGVSNVYLLFASR